MTSSSVTPIHRGNRVYGNAGAGETRSNRKGQVEISGNRRSEMKGEKQCNPDATDTWIASEMLQVDARKP
jgi:hypothetical protein